MSEVGQRSDSLTKGDRDVRGPRGINIQRNESISQDIANTSVVDAVMQATNTNTTAPVMSTGSVDHQRMVVDLSLPSVDTNRKYLPLRTTAPLEPIPIPIDTVDEPEFDKHKVLDAKIDILLENLCKSPDLFDQRFYESMIHTKNWSEQISKGRMRHYLLNDVIYCVIIKILTEKDSSNLKYTLPRSFRRSLTRNEYTIRNGLLYFSGADDTKLAPDQVIWKDFEGRKAHAEGYCVPPKLRNVVMDYFHTALELAHQGMQRLQYLMEGRVYWKGMIADIRRYVKRCQTCHLAKQTSNKSEGLMQLFESDETFHTVHIDIVGTMPVTKSGNRYILTIMDRYSRMVKCICIPSITAVAVAEAFRNHWLLQYGTPKFILSDRGSQFTGLIFEVLAKLSGFEQRFTTAYHPETNGRLERFHRFLKQRLRCIAHDHNLDFLNMHDWDVFIPGIAFAYNVTPNRMTEHCPYEVVFGKRVRLPIDAHFETDPHRVAEDVVQRRKYAPGASGKFALNAGHRSYIDKMAEYYQAMDAHIKFNMIRYNAQRKVDYDKHRIPPTEYYNGDEVWIDADERHVGNVKKLPINRVHGVIVDKIGDNAYTLRLSKSHRYVPVNVSQIYKILPVEADETKSNDGLTKSARAHIQTGQTVAAKYNDRVRKVKQAKERRKRKRSTANDTAEPQRKRPRIDPRDRTADALIRPPLSPRRRPADSIVRTRK